MNNRDIQKLIQKYIAGECSVEEKELLEQWYTIELQEQLSQISTENDSQVKEELWESIINERPELRKNKSYWYSWTTVAAILLAVIYISYNILNREGVDYVMNENPQAPNSRVIPGGHKAILTMGDGKQINLTDIKLGVIEQNENFIVRKDEDGSISFEILKQPLASFAINNKIETPKGGIFQVVLPDGSKAWLNSASSISFPSDFIENERSVTIEGEVYFEVHTDKIRPFRVKASNQLIEVLGTKFNVNAYHDEPNVRTTLLEGKIQVQGLNKNIVLDPGYEFTTSKNGVDQISKADLEAITAWKDGIFQFDRVDLGVLMRQLARWYDVEIVYTSEFPKDEFVGKIKRNENINKVLEVLKYGNIDINLEGRKLMVGQKM